MKRCDIYRVTTPIAWAIYTNHPDGRPESFESTIDDPNNPSTKGTKSYTKYFYDPISKMCVKIESTSLNLTTTMEFTYANGRITRMLTTTSVAWTESLFEYEGTKMVKRTDQLNMPLVGAYFLPVVSTYSYNSDGTLDKITTLEQGTNASSTVKYTWENGKVPADCEYLWTFLAIFG